MKQTVFEKIVVRFSEEEVRYAIAIYAEEKCGGNIPMGCVSLRVDNSADVVISETEITGVTERHPNDHQMTTEDLVTACDAG